MDVSILIVNWNTRQYLKECLQSIHSTVKNLTYEVIVVDNASHDGSAEMVRQEFPQVHLLDSPANLGYARGNNLALSRSTGHYLLLMNPDVVLLEGTVEGLVSFAREHPQAGILSPKLLNPDRSLQNFYGRIPTLSTVFFVYTRIGDWLDRRLLRGRARARERYLKYGDFQDPLWLTDGGAGFSCTLISRNTVEKIGFMDELYPVFFNDGDFAMRVFMSGYKACITPHVQAIHHGGSSTKLLDRLVYNKEYVYGLRTYNKKFKGFFYTRIIEAILSLNVLSELASNVKAFLQRKKGLASVAEPLVSFIKTLVYKPENIRPLVYRLPANSESTVETENHGPSAK